MTKATNDPQTLSFEQARDELVTIVTNLESGTGTLDESMALWERGEALARRCDVLLDGAEQTIAAAIKQGAADPKD